jgi:Domain of unknown function (DUF4402)
MIRKVAQCRVWRLSSKAALLALACVLSSPSFAASRPATSTAAVVTAGQLVKVQDLRFGLIVPAATAGTVRITPATAARSKTGGPLLTGAGFGPAEFIALGNPLQNNFLQLILPNTATLNRAGGGGSMLVNNFTFSGSGASVLNAQGFYRFYVGATLAVGANQAYGTYSGTFNMTVNFN